MPNAIVRASATALPKSRRAALALFAGLPALAIVPSTVLAMPREPDAELISLGAEVERIAAKSADIGANQVEPLEDEFQDILRRDGISSESLAEANAFSEASGRNAAIEDQFALDGLADRLFARMMAIPATTQAGRAAKVRALLSHVMPKDWRGPARDLDWPAEQGRAVLGEFAGMSAEELAAI
jgi:hypothetical protein